MLDKTQHFLAICQHKGELCAQTMILLEYSWNSITKELGMLCVMILKGYDNEIAGSYYSRYSEYIAMLS